MFDVGFLAGMKCRCQQHLALHALASSGAAGLPGDPARQGGRLATRGREQGPVAPGERDAHPPESPRCRV